ncbi:MAG: hypothetical protein KF724_07110 [Phycisphaeraceae bacterium]|nr:hypothetical protein [Phycisphaeraceae bacterium]
MIALPPLVLSILIALPSGQGGDAPEMPEIMTAWTLHDLALPAGTPENFEIQVDLGGTPTLVSFSRYSVRSHNFQLLVDYGQGELVEVDAPPSLTYRGTVAGIPNAVAAAALHDDGLSAMIRLPEGITWMIEPVGRLIGETTDTRHAFYRGSDLLPTGHVCATDLLGFEPAEVMEGGIATDTPAWTEIGIDTDFEFFQKNGSNVTLTLNDIELVMNNVDAVYTNDLQISYEITTVIIRASSDDPYAATTIGNRLCEFRSVWNSTPESSIVRDIAHMFSGFNYSGGTIGIAWLGVVCNKNGNVCGSGNGNVGYSIVESKYLSNTPLFLRISLSAHELGHNWNATHCDSEGNPNCNIMCSSNNGCGGVNGSNLKFNTLSINQITAYRNSNSCTPVIAAPLSLPFIETFPAVSVNSTRWIFNKGGLISSAAQNKPSSPYTLRLSSSGSNPYHPHEIRSNRILMAGTGEVRLSYFTQHVGVPVDQQFFVDYVNSAGKWVNINTITSTGVNQTTFSYWEHVLPANAKHNKFRIRFRTTGTAGSHIWYIDDVKVDLPPACPADLNGNNSVEGSDLAILLGAWGTNLPAADLNGNGVVEGGDLAILLGAWGACP